MERKGITNREIGGKAREGTGDERAHYRVDGAGSANCSQYAHTSHCCAELSSSDSYPTMSREPSIPELDLSDDEHHFTEISNRKRSSRGEYYHSTLLSHPFSQARLACDQCRKTKSKCERFKGDDEPCKSCSAAGTGTEHIPLRTTYA